MHGGVCAAELSGLQSPGQLRGVVDRAHDAVAVEFIGEFPVGFMVRDDGHGPGGQHTNPIGEQHADLDLGQPDGAQGVAADPVIPTGNFIDLIGNDTTARSLAGVARV